MSGPWMASFPEGWRRLRLKNLVAEVRNGTWGEEPTEDEGTVCVRSADFDRQRLRISTEKLVRRALTARELRLHRLEPGDLILEKSGGGEEQPVGLAVLYDLQFEAVATNFAARVRAAYEVEPRYLCYALAAIYYAGINERSIKQTTGIQNLDSSSFFNEPWAIPHLREQRAIADHLDRETARIDALIFKKRTLAKCLLQRRTVLITAAVTGQLRAGTVDVSLAPERPLRAMAEVALGRQRSPEHAEGPHMTPYLRAVNVGNGVLDLSDVKEMNFTPGEGAVYSLKPGDVLITEGSGSLDTVGASAVWHGEITGLVCFQNTLLRARPRPGMSSAFLAWWCRHAFESGLFASIATGANIYHLSAERIRGLPIRLPSPEAQRAIADFLKADTEEVEAAIRKIRRQVGLLEEHRQALITAAATGQYHVPAA